MTRSDQSRSSRHHKSDTKKEHHAPAGFSNGFSTSAFHSSGSGLHSSGHQSNSLGGGSHDVMDATFIWKLTKLGRIGSSRLRFDDDFADRLNYQFTGVLMFLFIGLIGIRQYVGKPIQCWVPQVFTRGWEEYAENYCWVANTYFSSVNGRLPDENERVSRQLGYYQWVPVMLAIQALLVYLPCLIWRLLMGYSGFNLRRIIQMACDSNLLLPEHTLKNVRFIARYMEGCIYRQRDYKRRLRAKNMNGFSSKTFPNQNGQHGPAYGVPPPLYSNGKTSLQHQISNGNVKSPDTEDSNNFINKIRNKSTLITSKNENNKVNGKLNEMNAKSNHCSISKSEKRKISLLLCGRKYGNYLTVLYFTVKVIYLINIVGQMYLMERFIGANESYYGITILQNFINGKDWQLTGKFPRITFCDFNAKKLGENDAYSIQCVLPLNMFLEKIYIFLWFWYILVGIVTLFSFISWFLRMGFAKRRIKFIRKYLKILCVMKDTDQNTTKKFVENYLRSDGVFIIRLISINIGDFLAGDLVCELWHIYRHKQLQDFDEVKMTDSDLSCLLGMTPCNGGNELVMQQQQFSQQNSINKSNKIFYQSNVKSAPPPPPLMTNNAMKKESKDLSNNNDDSIV